jgi:sulfur-carrier protein
MRIDIHRHRNSTMPHSLLHHLRMHTSRHQYRSRTMPQITKPTCYNTNMNIRIRYFASLRETAEKNEEALTLPEGATVAALRETLLARYPRLQTVMERALCAVNHQYVSLETMLHEGDEVVFIPPVGGGC